jgi:hypothetical protein
MITKHPLSSCAPPRAIRAIRLTGHNCFSFTNLEPHFADCFFSYRTATGCNVIIQGPSGGHSEALSKLALLVGALVYLMFVLPNWRPEPLGLLIVYPSIVF